MKSICLCFHVHHPFHFQAFRFFDIEGAKSYYDDQRIVREIYEAATNFYLPANDFLLRLIQKCKGKLKLVFYISGTSIDQFLMYTPEVLSSFRQLADTGQVEFLGGTSSHSLVSLSGKKNELFRQLVNYQSRIENLFGVTPRVFVNSDLIYSDRIGKEVADIGYRALIANGSGKILNWRSPNYVYSNCDHPALNIYFRNEQFSNELAFRLNDMNFAENEPNINRLLFLLNNPEQNGPLLNIYLNYMLLGGFGIEKKQKIIQSLVTMINRNNDFCFIFPSEIAGKYDPVSEISTSEISCWVNNFHSSYYPGNELQREAIHQLYRLEKKVTICENPSLLKDWLYLQTTDHIHLMDEQHPSYQQNDSSGSMDRSKYDAFINYMNILEAFRLRLKEELKKKEKIHSLFPDKTEMKTTKQSIPNSNYKNLKPKRIIN